MNFVDSSVFVSLFDETDPARQGRARAIVRSALQESWTVSHQVVAETLDILTRKTPEPMTAEQTRRFLDEVLLPLCSVAPSQELYRRALDIQSRYRYGFHDALNIAEALEAGCVGLLTERLSHGQNIEGLTIENPFPQPPES